MLVHILADCVFDHVVVQWPGGLRLTLDVVLEELWQELGIASCHVVLQRSLVDLDRCLAPAFQLGLVQRLGDEDTGIAQRFCHLRVGILASRGVDGFKNFLGRLDILDDRHFIGMIESLAENALAFLGERLFSWRIVLRQLEECGNEREDEGIGGLLAEVDIDEVDDSLLEVYGFDCWER